MQYRDHSLFIQTKLTSFLSGQSEYMTQNRQLDKKTGKMNEDGIAVDKEGIDKVKEDGQTWNNCIRRKNRPKQNLFLEPLASFDHVQKCLFKFSYRWLFKLKTKNVNKPCFDFFINLFFFLTQFIYKVRLTLGKKDNQTLLEGLKRLLNYRLAN